MTKSLVIVESPAKARTIAGFLGRDYVVESSIGHVRDLPKRAGDVPAKYKKAAWARLGVDVDNDFKPLYVVDPDKKAHLDVLAKKLKESDELLLATDEDREGESIAWHLLEVLAPKVPVKRMVFHEITKKAIQHAIDNPREIDRHLVDAQEARRILDRLYGYEVSPVLWKKVMPRLSAGRVQSVATRIIVNREHARMRFRVASYWDIEGTFAKRPASEGQLAATLTSIDGVRLVSGKDFGEDGRVQSKNEVTLLDEAAARRLAEDMVKATFTVASIEHKPYRRSPSPPFMTSTLQQEAGRKLRFAAQRTMRAAQRLYESGYITYMRTDSTTLSDAALAAARTQISELYGADQVPNAPRTYKNKVKNAQEAHEAIRPAGDAFRTPEVVAREVAPDEAALYELIWKRTVASQMKDAEGQSVQVRIGGTVASGKRVELAVGGNTITFPGFLRAYVEGSDDPGADLEERERHLPVLREGETLDGLSFVPAGHETQPPARFTEASLVRKLEELGVGRPSTYASIIGTIQERGYVWKKGTALVPSFKAFAVVNLLERHFGHLVDFAFTAKMEDDLDQIASGEAATIPWLKRFYFGDESGGKSETNGVQAGAGLRRMVSEQLEAIDAREINTVRIGHDDAGVEVVVRVGRYGPYLQRGEDTVSVPEDLPPDQVTREKALELLSAPSGEKPLGTDPESGLTVILKKGRFGSYVQLGEMIDGAKEKPKTASILRTMDVENITLEDALKVLSLPRSVGVDPADGVEITAHNGRYGPYITKGSENRSLENDGQLFSLTVEEALKILAEPKKARGRMTAEPLKELGDDPVSGKKITLRKGRFGPYVTDGDTHASLRSGDDPESITPHRAQELIAARRERGPVVKKTRGNKRGGAKKPAKAATKAAAPKAEKPAKAAKKAAKPKKAKGAKKAKASKPSAPKTAKDDKKASPPAVLPMDSA